MKKLITTILFLCVLFIVTINCFAFPTQWEMKKMINSYIKKDLKYPPSLTYYNDNSDVIPFSRIKNGTLKYLGKLSYYEFTVDYSAINSYGGHERKTRSFYIYKNINDNGFHVSIELTDEELEEWRENTQIELCKWVSNKISTLSNFKAGRVIIKIAINREREVIDMEILRSNQTDSINNEILKRLEGLQGNLLIPDKEELKENAYFILPISLRHYY